MDNPNVYFMVSEVNSNKNGPVVKIFPFCL